MSQDAEFEVKNVICEKTLKKTLILIMYNNDKWTFKLSDSRNSSDSPQIIWCAGFKFDKDNMYAIVVQENKSYHEIAIEEPQWSVFKVLFRRFKQNCYTHLSLLNDRGVAVLIEDKIKC